MDLNPAQVALQLGIAGALLFVVDRIARIVIANWRESEKERTAAIADGFKSITQSVNNHSAADVASHDRLSESHGELRDAVVRVEGKVDAALDWQGANGRVTPAAGVVIRRPKTSGGG